jgi:hypothetical protein
VPIREVVSQISPPIRILLVLTIAVMGVYMLFLRPKPEEIPPVEPAGTTVTQPGTDASAETATATPPATEPSPAPAPAAADVDLKGLPKPVSKAIRADKVLVILFSNGKSADDRAVEAAMKDVDDWNGRVYVHTAPLTRISRWGRIARGVNVEQSPTVVVADRDLRADTLVGYVDRTTIDQAVVDALRNSSGLFTSAYLRQVNKVCVQWGHRAQAIPHFYGGTMPQADRRLVRYHAVAKKYAGRFAAIDAPKRYAAFHRASVADHKALLAQMAAFSSAVTPKSGPAAALAAEQRYTSATRPIGKRYNARADALGLHRCGSQF